MKYIAHFYGRSVGAIGIFYWIDAVVDLEQPDIESARLQLYERYDHIQQLTLRPATEPERIDAQ